MHRGMFSLEGYRCMGQTTKSSPNRMGEQSARFNQKKSGAHADHRPLQLLQRVLPRWRPKARDGGDLAGPVGEEVQHARLGAGPEVVRFLVAIAVRSATSESVDVAAGRAAVAAVAASISAGPGVRVLFVVAADAQEFTAATGAAVGHARIRPVKGAAVIAASAAAVAAQGRHATERRAHRGMPRAPRPVEALHEGGRRMKDSI